MDLHKFISFGIIERHLNKFNAEAKMSKKGKRAEVYADNYVKPRVIPILLVVLLLISLLILEFWAFTANHTIFEPWLRGLSFCVLMVALMLFVPELLHRLWPVRTRHLKDRTRINFYLGWRREVERTEFADGRCPIYSTSDGETYYDPRELAERPEVKRAEEDFKSGHGITRDWVRNDK